MNIREQFEIAPIITAVKNEAGLERAMKTDSTVVFILYGTILNIHNIVEKIKDHGKFAIVHVDLIAGLNSKEVAVDFIKEYTRADGIISTKPMLVRRGMELGLVAGQRFFMIDSIALDSMKKQMDTLKPDFMEVMPGVMPGVLKRIRSVTDIPLVAGGLLSEKKDIMAAFDAGVDAVSTTNEGLWYV